MGDTRKAIETFLEIRLLPYISAVERVLDHTEIDDIVKRWSGALGYESTYSVFEWQD
jgi:hypothetical protein